MNKDKSKPFVIEQLDEALEERQTPERRRGDEGPQGHSHQDRRKNDRRAARNQAAQ